MKKTVVSVFRVDNAQRIAQFARVSLVALGALNLLGNKANDMLSTVANALATPIGASAL